MPRGKVKTISESKVIQWMKDNLGDWYIGYRSDGEPYIDTEVLLRDFRKAFKDK